MRLFSATPATCAALRASDYFAIRDTERPPDFWPLFDARADDSGPLSFAAADATPHFEQARRKNIEYGTRRATRASFQCFSFAGARIAKDLYRRFISYCSYMPAEPPLYACGHFRLMIAARGFFGTRARGVIALAIRHLRAARGGDDLLCSRFQGARAKDAFLRVRRIRARRHIALILL